MIDSAPHLAALEEFYQGEILGEAMFDAMLAALTEPAERYTMGLLLQLESETKVRLRPVLAEHGLPLQEDVRMRLRGEQFAQALAGASWAGKMKALHQSIVQTYLPRYRELTAALPLSLRAVGQSMVEHEQALADLCGQELAGGDGRSDPPVLRLLQHPLPRPAGRP